MASSRLCRWCPAAIQGSHPQRLRKRCCLSTINNQHWMSPTLSPPLLGGRTNRLFALGAEPLARLVVKPTSNYLKPQAFERHSRMCKQFITTAPNHRAGKWILTLAIVINTRLGVNYTVHIFTTHLFPPSFRTTSKLVGFVHWFPVCHLKTRTGILAIRQKAVKGKKEKPQYSERTLLSDG